MQDASALDLARLFSQFLHTFMSYKSVFFLQSRLIIQFLDTSFDELLKFCTHDARGCVETAGEVRGWIILYGGDFMKCVNFIIFIH